MSVKIEGVEELLNALAETEAEMRKATHRANTAGAKVVQAELERTVPWSKMFGSSVPFAKDNVAISNNRTDSGTGESFVAVGFNKKVSYRIHFLEFGTISQNPSAFMTNTSKTTARDVESAMLDEVKKVFI